jgi:hypothetical protein
MFFERNFRPLRITKLGDTAGFLTGYYEPIVDESRFPTGIFASCLARACGTGAQRFEKVIKDSQRASFLGWIVPGRRGNGIGFGFHSGRA